MRLCNLATIVAVVAATVVSATVMSRRGDSSASGTFTQYESRIFQYRSQTPLATWNEVPFDGTINGTLYVPKYDVFALLVRDDTHTPVATDLWVLSNTSAQVPTLTSSGQFSSSGSVCELSNPTADGAGFYIACRSESTSATSLFLCSGPGLSCSSLTEALPLAGLEPSSVILSVAQYTVGSATTLLIGTSQALYACASASDCATIEMTNTTGGLTTVHHVSRVFCLDEAITTDPGDFFNGRCFAVSRNTVCTSNLCPADLVHVLNASLAAVRFIRVPGVVDAWPRGIAYDPIDDAIHFADSAAVNTLHRNCSLHRVGGVHGGLPQWNLTSAAANGLGAWFGSKFGAMLREPAGNWKYFYGPRWLPGESASASPGMSVTAVAASGVTGDAVVVTETGFSVIARVSWTLDEKADLLQSYEAHFWRWGLAPASQPLAEFGKPSTRKMSDSANEGLWTSMYLASQVFRYASTGDPESKANAWTAFNGMRTLCLVTGVRGLCAREFSNVSHEGQNGWYPSTTMPGWWFNGNPSSDEVTGHLHAYPLLHDLVAETDEERELVLGVIKNITGNIVDNGLILHTIQGVPTVWGRWNPSTLNDEPKWYDERGLNSLQILGFLSSAYRLTANETYADVYRDLVVNHGYGANLVNLKITQPSDVDFSDDELTYLAYLCLQWSSRPSALFPSGNPLWSMVQREYEASLDRTFAYTHRYRPALWGAIYLLGFGASNSSASTAPRADMAKGDVRWCLETWPTSPVRWPINNSARLDVRYSPYPNRNGWMHMLLTTMLPYDEISAMVLNSDPFDKAQGSAFEIDNPSFWLYPFWLGRWLSVV